MVCGILTCLSYRKKIYHTSGGRKRYVAHRSKVSLGFVTEIENVFWATGLARLNR